MSKHEPPPEPERHLLPIDREIPPEFIDWERVKHRDNQDKEGNRT